MKLSDVTFIQILGAILVVNGALAGALNELTDLLGPAMAKHVLSVCVIGSGICGGFITMFGGIGSQARNVAAAIAVDPLQDKIAPITAAMNKATATATAAKAIIILALLAGGLIFVVGDAFAQGGTRVRLPEPLNLGKQAAAVPTPAAKPAAAAAIDPLTKFMNDLEKVQQDTVTGIVGDFTAADADAASLTNSSDPTSFKDPISHACYPAAIKFLQELPVATPTTGKFILVQLFQKKRDFVAQIQAGIPVYLKLGCAPLLGDEAMIFTKLMGLVGVQVGLNALAPGLGLAMPVL